MPLYRRDVGAGLLAGVGEGLQNYAEMRLRRRQREDEMAQQQAFEIQKMRMQQAFQTQQLQQQMLSKLLTDVSADPTKARQLIDVAKKNPFMPDLPGGLDTLMPTDASVVAGLQQKIEQVPKEENLPTDVGRMATQAGLDAQQVPPTGVPPSAAAPGDQAASDAGLPPFQLPVTAPPPQLTTTTDEIPGEVKTQPAGATSPDLQIGAGPADLVDQLKQRFAHNNPNIEALQRSVTERGTTLNQASADAITQKGKEAEAVARGTAFGKGLGEHETAPLRLEDEVAAIVAKGPAEAEAARQKSEAEFNATHSPDAIRKSMLLARAEADARNASENAARMERIKAGVDPSQQQAALQLSDNFTKDSQTFRTKEESMRSILYYVNHPSPAGDYALMFAYIKMIDPGSTVREGERYDLAQASSVPMQVRVLYNMALDGQLPAEKRADIAGQAIGTYQAAVEGQKRVIQDYTARALQQVGPNGASLVVRQLDPALDLNPATFHAAAVPQSGPPRPLPPDSLAGRIANQK